MVGFLLALLVSLTFNCWWRLGDFCNIEDDTEGLLDEGVVMRRPWMLRLHKGRLHNVKA
ncbi:hypothetical protein AAVH_41603, partial [Aphelenchoides avenae]